MKPYIDGPYYIIDQEVKEQIKKNDENIGKVSIILIGAFIIYLILGWVT